MKIVIDGRLWFESGIGRYIRNLVFNLQKIDKKNEYLTLLLRKDFNTVQYESVNFHKVLADFKWYGLDEQIKLPWLLRSLKPDLVHFPHFNVPIFYSGKFVVTIHDLIHQHFQTRETTTLNPIVHGIKKNGYRIVFSQALKKSVRVITPSNFVKDQLVKEWKLDDKKIVVTHEAVDEGIIDLAKRQGEFSFEKLKKKFSISEPYLFYIGNAQPHKNINQLIGVFRELRKDYPQLQLVLSGPNNLFWQKIKLEDVIFTGFVTEEEMVVLYNNALSFIMPSLEEGFGIPVLEAMASRCPVISSSAGSLPEVGGEAALYFNPKDKEEMRGKIKMVIKDDKLRKELIKKGEERYKQFSWQDLAQQTLKVYASCFGA